MENHKCIVSCDICLKHAQELENRIDRATEILEEVGSCKKELLKILKGESH